MPKPDGPHVPQATRVRPAVGNGFRHECEPRDIDWAVIPREDPGYAAHREQPQLLSMICLSRAASRPSARIRTASSSEPTPSQNRLRTCNTTPNTIETNERMPVIID